MIEINSDKKLNASFSSGFTLMEVMLSVSILSMGIVGSFSLISSSMARFSTASNKIIAANLAQDGIERVRNVRDTNWLQAKTKIHGHVSQSWDDGINGGSSQDLIGFSCVDGIESGIGGPYTGIDQCVDAGKCKVYRYYNGASWADSSSRCISDDFGASQGGYTGEPYLNFYRFIFLESLNDYSNRVTVTVRWGAGADKKYFIAQEVLYNWKETIP